MSDPQVDRMNVMGHSAAIVLAREILHADGSLAYTRAQVQRLCELVEADHRNNRGAVSLAALREIAREMYDGLEVGSPEQLAVSEFLGRAESLGGQ